MMKRALLVICALGYGVLPAILEAPHVSLFTLFIPVLLGLIYFGFYQYDWPPRLITWLFACIAGGRLGGYWWMNLRYGRVGPLVDGDVWIFGALAAVGFAFAWYRRLRDHTEIPNDANPKST